MTTLIRAMANGVLLGMMYTAISAGLSLTLGVMGLVNVAHSAVAMLGAYVAWEMLQRSGIDPLLALVLVTIAFFFLGMIIERLLVRRVYNEPPVASLLSLFGLMIVIESAMILIWTTTERALPVPYAPAIDLLGLRLSVARLVGGGVSLAAVFATHLYLKHSRTGRGIRAMASNRDAARMLGIDTDHLSMVLFGIGTALAGAGGVAMAMVFTFIPQLHLSWLTLAILVVVIGGLGSIPRTMAAALVIALVESLAGAYLPFEYVTVVLYALLIGTLWVRREGIARTEARTL